MLAGLGMMLHVIIAPNSAFAEIRDNAGRYFLWSVGIAVFVCILYAVIDLWAPLVEYQSNIAIGIATSILSIFAYTALIYLIGRGLGGNKNWKQVFATMFYVEVISIPLFVSSILVGQTASTASWDFLLLAIALLLALIVWLVVVMVKAVKVVNGFGTAKAFGLIVLVGVIITIISTPSIVWYYQDIITTL